MLARHVFPQSEVHSNGCSTGRATANDVGLGPSGLSGVWRVFTSQLGLGVMLVRPDNCVEYVNESYLRDYIPLDADQVVGKFIPDLFTNLVTVEIEAAIGRVAGTDIQLIRKVLFGGRRLQVTYRWLADEQGGDGHVLITLQRGYREPEDEKNVVIEQAGFIDLGPLSVLTDRELEVLALVGQGLRVKEVAERLHRSPKTIESHVGSIFRKLGTRDRAVMMRIASDAGLELKMISKPRVEAIRVNPDS